MGRALLFAHGWLYAGFSAGHGKMFDRPANGRDSSIYGYVLRF